MKGATTTRERDPACVHESGNARGEGPVHAPEAILDRSTGGDTGGEVYWWDGVVEPKGPRVGVRPRD